MVNKTVLNNISFDYNDSFDNLYNKIIENKDYYCSDIEMEMFKDVKLITPIKYDIKGDKILNLQITILKTLNNYYICYLNEIDVNSNFSYMDWILFRVSKEELIKYFLNEECISNIIKNKKLLGLRTLEVNLYFPIEHKRYVNTLRNFDEKHNIIDKNFSYYYETKSVSDSIDKLLDDLDLKFDYLTDKVINKFECDGTIFTNLDN